MFAEDAAFEDYDHEWYESAEDSYEFVNLANDVGCKNELCQYFNWLFEIECVEFGDAAGHGGAMNSAGRS